MRKTKGYYAAMFDDLDTPLGPAVGGPPADKLRKMTPAGRRTFAKRFVAKHYPNRDVGRLRKVYFVGKVRAKATRHSRSR
jgi:hypothetical protein